jgi:hypothetical protein
MEVLVIYTWGTSIVARARSPIGSTGKLHWDLEGWERDLLEFDVDFRGLRRSLKNWRGRPVA